MILERIKKEKKKKSSGGKTGGKGEISGKNGDESEYSGSDDGATAAVVKYLAGSGRSSRREGERQKKA